MYAEVWKDEYPINDIVELDTHITVLYKVV